MSLARVSQLRSSQSLKRKAGNRQPRFITLIVCEGETEQTYFDAVRRHFGLSTTEVVVADNYEGAAPISVVKCAERKCAEPGGFDQVFCVFDRDGHESYDRARQRIALLAARTQRPLSIAAIASVPCFEIWVLLHFEKSDAPFNRCADVITRVKVNMPHYEKADARAIRELLPRLETANENASWLELRGRDINHNPSTNVHHLIRHFAETQAKNRREPNA